MRVWVWGCGLKLFLVLTGLKFKGSPGYKRAFAEFGFLAGQWLGSFAVSWYGGDGYLKG